MTSLIIAEDPTRCQNRYRTQHKLMTNLHLSPEYLRHSGSEHLRADRRPLTQIHVVALDGVDLHCAAHERQRLGADIDPRFPGEVVEYGCIGNDPAAGRVLAHLVDLNAEPFGRFRCERYL